MLAAAYAPRQVSETSDVISKLLLAHREIRRLQGADDNDDGGRRPGRRSRSSSSRSPSPPPQQQQQQRQPKSRAKKPLKSVLQGSLSKIIEELERKQRRSQQRTGSDGFSTLPPEIPSKLDPVLHDIKTLFDSQSNGIGLHEDEFLQIFGKFFVPGVSDSERAQWFTTIDYDANGIVGWEEFCNYLMSCKHLPTLSDGQDFSRYPAAYEAKGHRDSITHFIHNTINDVYYSAGDDGAVLAWSPTNLTQNGRVIHQCPPSSQLTDMRWIPSANRLLVLQADRTVAVYDCAVIGRGRSALLKMFKGVDMYKPKKQTPEYAELVRSLTRQRPYAQRVVETTPETLRQGIASEFVAMLRGKEAAPQKQKRRHGSLQPLQKTRPAAPLAPTRTPDTAAEVVALMRGHAAEAEDEGSGALRADTEIQSIEALPLYDLVKPSLCIDFVPWDTAGGSYLIGTAEGMVCRYSARRLEGASHGSEDLCRPTRWKVHDSQSFVTKVLAVQSVDGLISSATDDTIQLFNIEKEVSYVRMRDETVVTPVHSLCRRDNRAVFGFDFSPELNLLASWGENRKFIIWNPLTATCLFQRMEHMHPIAQVLFKPNHQLISLSIDKTIKIWDTRTFRCVQTLVDKQLRIKEDHFRSLAWDNERQSIVTGGTEPVLFRTKAVQERVEAGINPKQVQGHVRPIIAALLIQGSGYVVTLDRDSILTWEIMTGRKVCAWVPDFLDCGAFKITAACVSVNSRRMAIAVDNGFIYLVNCLKKVLLKVCNSQSRDELTVCMSAVLSDYVQGAGSYLLAGGNANRVVVFKDNITATDQLEQRPYAHLTLDTGGTRGGSTLGLRFLPPSRVIIGTSRGSILIYSLSTMSLVSVANEADKSVRSLGLVVSAFASATTANMECDEPDPAALPPLPAPGSDAALVQSLGTEVPPPQAAVMPPCTEEGRSSIAADTNAEASMASASGAAAGPGGWRARMPTLVKSALKSNREMAEKTGGHAFNALNSVTQKYVTNAIEALVVLGPMVVATAHGNGDLCVWRLNKEPQAATMHSCVPGAYHAGEAARVLELSPFNPDLLHVGDDLGYVSVFDLRQCLKGAARADVYERRRKHGGGDESQIASPTAAAAEAGAVGGGGTHRLSQQQMLLQAAGASKTIRRRASSLLSQQDSCTIPAGGGGGGGGGGGSASAAGAATPAAMTSPGGGRVPRNQDDISLVLCYKAHAKCVNVIVMFGEAEHWFVATGGNDCVVKVWSSAGEHLSTFGNRGGWGKVFATVPELQRGTLDLEADDGHAPCPVEPADVEADTRSIISRHYFAALYPAHVRHPVDKTTTFGDVLHSNANAAAAAAGGGGGGTRRGGPRDTPPTDHAATMPPALSARMQTPPPVPPAEDEVEGALGESARSSSALPSLVAGHQRAGATNMQRMLDYSMKKTCDPAVRKYARSGSPSFPPPFFFFASLIFHHQLSGI